MHRNLFFTSDTHFGHKNIIKYSNRPFRTVDEMDSALIDNINETVPHDGVLYHAGDFAFGDADFIRSILDRIACRVIFIDGNHDGEMRGDVRGKLDPLSARTTRGTPLPGIKQKSVPGLELRVTDSDVPRGEQLIYLCHYPSITWNRAHHGSWMLHGHCHGNLKYPFKGRIMDIGVDPNGYKPVSYEDVKRHMKSIDPEFLDHHVGD